MIPDFDAMAREWLTAQPYAYDIPHSRWAESQNNLSALLRQTYERGVRDEREACALVAAAHDVVDRGMAKTIAAAIRARTP